MRRKRSPVSQPPSLTPQERQVLQSIWEGHSIAQTADLLEVDLRPAESARNALKYKFGARNTAQLIREALRYGMVTV
jgi:DNA-binding CsgD family transcriptional regulator